MTNPIERARDAVVCTFTVLHDPRIALMAIDRFIIALEAEGLCIVPKELVERLRTLSTPDAEILSDYARINAFVAVGFDIAAALNSKEKE